VNFIVDAQLPPALVRWICDRGHNATHAFDLGFQVTEDTRIWEYAQSQNAILIGKDEDLVDFWILSKKPVRLVWIRKGDCLNAALVSWLAPLWNDAVKRLEQGEQFIELRS
jgi:predicted nuclease of predicted toxin-antitoxin system